MAHTPKPTFKKGMIRPELKDLPHKVEDIPWTRSLNTITTNCTFADILLNMAQVLDKHKTNYINMHKCCQNHYFNRNLNSHKCTLHQRDWYMAEATYMYDPPLLD
jgi:hypothetical protein